MRDAGAAEAVIEDIIIETRGAAIIVTLDRPRALNALTTAMRRELDVRIPVIARDPENYAVVIRSANAKAFSAGGDVRELVDWGRSSRELARRAFHDEYQLNWKLECFCKPTVSLIDGMVMGSGVGLTLYNTHRVAGPGYRFAMPETAIGLFPDVGVCHVLSRLPASIGMYLGLTGRAIGRAEAFHLGLVTHCIGAEEFGSIEAALVEAYTIDPELDRRHADPGPGELERYREIIARCFSAPTVEEIFARLAAVEGSSKSWADAVLADLEKRSPLSLKLTHRHLRESIARDLRETLVVDYRLACRSLDGTDFYEGVRAALIDKDGAPKWQHARLKDVPSALVDTYFAPLDGDELALPMRSEMLDIRA